MKKLFILVFLLLSTPCFGATELFKTVKPAGGDFTTLEACMNANEQNLVTADKFFNVEISGDWTGVPDTTSVTIHNYTTDATRFINIFTTGTARHDGTAYKATAYKMQIAGNMIIFGAGNNITIDGIVFDGNNGNGTGILEVSAQTDNVYKDLIIYNSTDAVGSFQINASSTSGIIQNCILFDVKRGIFASSDNPNVTVYNCTVHGGNSPTLGISRLKTINCFVGGFGSEDFFSLSAGSDFNVSSDTSAADESSSNATGKSTFTDYFTSVTGGSEDYHLKNDSNSLWGLAGSDQSGVFTDDIDGDTRTVPWDIGADEFVGAVTTAGQVIFIMN